MNSHPSRPVFASILSILLLSLGSCAYPEVKTAVAEQNLAAPTAGEIKEHTMWLADDSLEGRRAGTPMADAAAVYIAEQLRASGLQPAGENGDWYQSFPISMTPRAGNCRLEVAGRSLAGVGSLALSAEGAVVGKLTSASYGVVLESYDIDHFAEVEAEGKVVLLRRYTEWGPDAEDKLARLGALRSKVRNARGAGAVAVIIGTHPDDVASGGDPQLSFDASHGTGGIPIVTVTPEQFVALERELGAEVSLEVNIERPRVETLNVIAKVVGKSDEVVTIGAHYDHLGWGGEGSLAPGVHAIHNGADDNASGSAVLLEVAEAVAAGPIPERTIVFCFWGAEEAGLIGSKFWVANPTVPLGKILTNVNLDMVGRLNSGTITVGSHTTAAAFKGAFAAAQKAVVSKPHGGASPSDLKLVMTGGDLPGGGGSDHMSFHAEDISAVFLFSGLHSDYHKPSDDWSKLDFARMGTLAEATVVLLAELCSASITDLAYIKPAPVAHGGGNASLHSGGMVWFGSIPDYAASGSGMTLAGTMPGGPAEAAGLIKNDVITAINDFGIVDIYDFMDALGVFKDGQTVIVHFIRAEQEMTTELTFFPRPGGD